MELNSLLEHLMSNTFVCDSLNLFQETKGHTRKYKTISLQLAPLKMLSLNEKQQFAGHTRDNITGNHGTHQFSLNVGLL
jgi:hypothetical protein